MLNLRIFVLQNYVLTTIKLKKQIKKKASDISIFIQLFLDHGKYCRVRHIHSINH